MGQLGDCIGFSIYEGEQGYRDLNSISLEYEEDRVIQYMMFDQTCLTFYMGDREEVPSSQNHDSSLRTIDSFNESLYK